MKNIEFLLLFSIISYVEALIRRLALSDRKNKHKKNAAEISADFGCVLNGSQAYNAACVRRSSALSVFSHGRSKSFRPK